MSNTKLSVSIKDENIKNMLKMLDASSIEYEMYGLSLEIDATKRENNKTLSTIMDLATDWELS